MTKESAAHSSINTLLRNRLEYPAEIKINIYAFEISLVAKTRRHAIISCSPFCDPQVVMFIEQKNLKT